MTKIKKIIFVLLLLFIPTYLCAMNEDNVIGNTSLQIKRSYNVSLYNQDISNREEESSNSPFAPKFLSCWDNIWSYWNNIGYMCKDLLKWNQDKAKEQKKNVSFLPNEMLLCIVDFLGSTDILRLSGVCKKFRQVFDGDYWITYLSKRPVAYSYLILNGHSLSPSLNRKAFFSHLWYSEGRINLAAKLNHPEALIIRDYGVFGAYIDKEQYLCPLKFIRYQSGEIDNERTEKLRGAERRKIKADLDKIASIQEKILRTQL